MKTKYFILFIIFTFSFTSLIAQSYERYKKLKDTTIQSTNLRFDKKISVTVPIEWQKGLKNNFPLIVVFDRQNKRSHQYILNTIDYLTSTEQIPSSVIVSIESEQRYRYIETQYKISEKNGIAEENEKFIFDELIPLAEKEFKASPVRIFVGHSRYGYFTTSLFSSRINDLTGVISMSPFFDQQNVDLTDSIKKLNNLTYHSKKYYRFAIGNDFPTDYNKMDSVITKNINNPFLNLKSTRFNQASHDVTPGLLIGNALYEVFEDWSFQQSKYISNQQKDLRIKSSLDRQIEKNYGARINFSLGILNGKGWYFYNEKQYEKAIQAWTILTDSYPNFSEGYLSIIKAKILLKQSYSQALEKFKLSLSQSELYKEQDKKELEKELQEIIK